MNFSKSKLRSLKYPGLVFLALISAYSQAMPSLKEMLIYDKASLENQNVFSGSAHQVVLSAPTRINNAPYIEKEKRVEGKKTVMLLRLDSKDTPVEAFAYYRAFIQKHGTVAYSCENRACGISSYWANSIFDERRLAGRDSDQYYVAGQVDMAGATYWVSVYLVANALRQNLVHVSYILPEGSKQSWQDAYLILPGATIPSPVMQAINDKMTQQPELKLYVAGYAAQSSGKEVSVIKSDLLAGYQKINKELASGLLSSANRIEFQFVGPFHSEPPIDANIWFRLFLLKP